MSTRALECGRCGRDHSSATPCKPVRTKTVNAKTLLRRAMRLVESGEDTTGICHACGAEREMTEPDAEHYPCEDCGQNEVYGAEQTVMMFA